MGAPHVDGPRHHIPATTRRSPTDLPSPPKQCEFGSGQYIVNPDRFTSCTDVIWELYTYTKVSGTTEITGSMNLEDLQWTSYNARSLSWTHGLQLSAYPGASGTLADGTSAYVKSQCDYRKNPCKVTKNLGTKDTKLVDLTPGSTLQDGWTETDTGKAAGTPGQTDVQTALGIKLVGPGGTGIPPWTFTDAYLTGRCDSIVTKKGGCVNQEFIPTFTLSLAEYGSSADMIEWAQKNLSGHWGLQGEGQPLHRLYNPSQTDINRGIICDKTFVASEAMNKALKPYGDKDSCDEFPFAATYESGAMTTGYNGEPKPHVTSGEDCAQVTAIQTAKTGKNEAEDWAKVEPIGTPAGTEPCVRGHIPNMLNGPVGTAYSVFISKQRLLNKDPFWISVTS
jgi:hypothetical protein